MSSCLGPDLNKTSLKKNNWTKPDSKKLSLVLLGLKKHLVAYKIFILYALLEMCIKACRDYDNFRGWNK